MCSFVCYFCTYQYPTYYLFVGSVGKTEDGPCHQKQQNRIQIHCSKQSILQIKNGNIFATANMQNCARVPVYSTEFLQNTIELSSRFCKFCRSEVKNFWYCSNCMQNGGNFHSYFLHCMQKNGNFQSRVLHFVWIRWRSAFVSLWSNGQLLEAY